MEAREFTIKASNFNFRVKPMSAVEALGLNTRIRANGPRNAKDSYEAILEAIEVQLDNGGAWLACKEPGLNVYCPVGLEDDVDAVAQLASKFFELFLNPVFRRSDELEK